MRPFALLLALAVTSLGALDLRARDLSPATLTVAGRSSQTPGAAALGDFVAVAFGAHAARSAPDVFIAVSRDGGRTFSAPVQVNAIEGDGRLGGELPPRVALVPRAGTDPEIVVAYGAKHDGTEIRLVRSTDGGRTFGATRALQAPGAPGDRGWHALTVDAAGTAHVMWLDHRGLAAPRTGDHEGGGARPHQAEKDALDGVAMAQRSGLYYARDGADPVRERELVKGVCYCCKVALAATPAGGLVAAWRHVYAGNVRDIAFITSADGGRSFTAPGRVSVDDWHLAGCPDDGPALAVDRSGRSHVVWPTVIGGASPEGALFYSWAAHGGSFAHRVRIPTLGSPKPAHPQVMVDEADRIFIAWDEVIGGVRQAAVARLRFDDRGGVTFDAPTRLGTRDTPTSYPVLAATSAGPLAVYVQGKAGESVIRVARV